VKLSIEPIKEGVLVKSEIQIQVLLMAIPLKFPGDNWNKMKLLGVKVSMEQSQIFWLSGVSQLLLLLFNT